jgi:hypothetical protein
MPVQIGSTISVVRIFSVGLTLALGPTLLSQSLAPGAPDPIQAKVPYAGFIALNKHFFGWYTLHGQVTFSDSALIFKTNKHHPLLLDSVAIPFRSIRGIHHSGGLWEFCMSDGDPIAIGIRDVKAFRSVPSIVNKPLLQRSECRTESRKTDSTEESPCDPVRGIPGRLKLSKHLFTARLSVPGCFYQGDTRFSPQVSGTLGSFFRTEVELTHLRHRKVYDRAFIRKLLAKH